MNFTDRFTPHFTLAEMIRTSVRQYSNWPGELHLVRLRYLCESILEPVRVHFGAPLIVHSAYRSPNVNAAVGGSSKSQHQSGEAADFHVVGVDHYSVARWIAAQLDYDQLILEFVDPSGMAGWLHCSAVDYKPGRRQVLRASRGPIGTKYETLTEIPRPA